MSDGNLFGSGLGGLLHDVLVAGGDAGVGVAEEAHGEPRRHPLDQEEGGGRVTGVVQAGVADGGQAEDPVPLGRVGFLTTRGAVLPGEHEAVVGPPAPGSRPLGCLGSGVATERLDHRCWQRQHPPAGGGLDGHDHRTTSVA